MTVLRIEGMHCGACVRRVTQALRTLPDTCIQDVQIGTAILESGATSDQMMAVVNEAGFFAQIEL